MILVISGPTASGKSRLAAELSEYKNIAIINADAFLKKGGLFFFAIKSQSIDVTKEPKIVFEAVLKQLEPHFEVVESMKLEPFDKDHLFLVLRKK